MITSAGVYRSAGFVDHGISETTNNFPQFVCRLTADEIYDPQAEQYVQGTGEDMLGYFVLFNKDGQPTLNLKQILKVTGFSGASLSGLAAMDLTGVPCLFRVEPHTYEGKETLQMTWIDVPEASPTKSVKKLDTDALKKLDSHYANAFKQAAGPAKPASAPATAPAAAPAPTAGPATEPAAPVKRRGRPAGTTNKPKVTETVVPATAPAAAPAAAPTVAKAPPKAPPKAAKPAVIGTCTKDEAWADVVDQKDANVTDDQLGSAWLSAIEAIAPGVEDEAVTPEQWFEVKESVLKATSVI